MATPSSGRGERRTGARCALGWALVVGLIVVAGWRLDHEALATTLRECAWPLLGLAALAHAASSVLKAVTWQGVLGVLPSTRGRSRPLDLVSPLLVGALVNSVAVARAGDVAKVTLARRRLARRGLDVPLSDIAGAMLAEHVVASAAWGAVVVALAVVAPMPAPVWLGAGLIGLASIGVAVLTGMRAPGAAGCRVGHGPGAARRALRWIGRAWGAMHISHRGLVRPRPLAVTTLGALGQWIFAWAAILAVLWSLGLGHVGPAGAGLVLVGLTLAHALPITPGGVGLNQLGAMLPLTATYGIAAEEALAFALVLTASESAVGMLLGAACATREAMRGPGPADAPAPPPRVPRPFRSFGRGPLPAREPAPPAPSREPVGESVGALELLAVQLGAERVGLPVAVADAEQVVVG